MRMIRPCSSCAAPVTVKMTRCPHCNATNPVGMVVRAASTVAAVVGGLSISSTLAACYGGPCAGDPNDTSCLAPTVPTCDEVSQQPKIDDADGDMYCKMQDCNENDAKINAAAREVAGDGIDQNCDGKDLPK